MQLNGITSMFKSLFLKLLLSLLLGFAVFGSLASADDNEMANKLCSKGYVTWPALDAVIDFETVLLLHLGLPEDTPNKEKHISRFFNENNSKLICEDDGSDFIRANEHILKRSLARSEHDFLLHIANSSKYEIDWNFYEIVDGKKETMLDYMDMIINHPELSEEYNIPELKSLMRVIEQDGGKRGRELD